MTYAAYKKKRSIERAVACALGVKKLLLHMCVSRVIPRGSGFVRFSLALSAPGQVCEGAGGINFFYIYYARERHHCNESRSKNF